MKYLFSLLLLLYLVPAGGQTNELLLFARLEPDLTDSVASRNKAAFFRKGLQVVLNDTALDERVKPFAALRWQDHSFDEFPYAAAEVSFIDRPGYQSLMHNGYHIPIYVAHCIDAARINSPMAGAIRASGYPKDPLYPALKKDVYASTGYDHGHLAPARDFKDDSALYRESNYMTNMAPQHGCFNQKGWCYIESLCRHWCTSDPGSTYYIVSGPVLRTTGQSLFIDSLCIRDDFKVFVPRYFFKAVLAINERTGGGKAIGFIIPNTSIENSEIRYMQTTIDELERATGLDLFAYLPNRIERKIEFQIGNFDFQGVRSECPEKDCDKVYTNRVLPEDRTKLICD